MARVEVPIIVLNPEGQPVDGAAVAITHRASGTPATWWTQETGGTSSTAAVVSDSNGRVSAWVERGAYNCAVSGTGITSYTEAFDATPAGDRTVDPLWLSASVLPSGLILPYGGGSSPNTSIWLLCDGSPVGRATYPDLFTAIGTFFGAGDGTSTFNLPDLQGRTIVGKGSHTEVSERGRTESGAITDAQLALASRRVKHRHGRGTLAMANAGAHTHNIDVPGFINAQHAGSDGSMVVYPTSPPNVGSNWLTAKSSGDHGHTLSGEIGATDSASPTDGPAFQVVNFLIKV